ncbi:MULTISPECIES: efflux RND transporter periplasmic adaptor subunit [Neptunomonas]|uniref:Efflux RND transporter periplasmic adaptor subunit n=1 Tax=Neptunomonas phycophila TaxID=1572645 RepID=A0AAW7XJG3_9GAMM|nr:MULTISPECIES: efflux RND transporter periplasmic adaptor subunit [Neptunomonas]MDN2658923.1 efflux RND transporter periplasmic adaptor subunit [Neptunomonas sp. CHC150]MDO6454541.1 efflux RND transporter periplasmic adaptor subunit [Neptunomonas phycophila]MDO6468883.1 efflux RND transporter periplasmic adaptor subunit [Neptunomonas phycophila]QLE97147.1 efflux RND transporter periplasmic adaptor subunit [Neptunomonas phycophila]
MSTPKLIRNFTLGTIAVMVLAACGGTETTAPSAPPPPPEITVATVIHERITEWDEFTGRLQAPQTVSLVPRVSGYIEKVLFQEGALVKKGDVLFLIDSQPFDTEVKRLKADLINAKAAAQLASHDYDRAKKLGKQRAISNEAVDNRRAQQQQTAAQVASVQAALTRAQLDVQYTKVTAPIDGRVSYAMVTEGNFVNAGQSELTSVVSTDTMYAYFDLDEQTYLKYDRLASAGKRVDARDTNADNPVYMGLANDTGYPHIGHIDFVDNRINQQTGTIRIRARFTNQDNSLIPGLFARVKLIGSDTYEGILIDNKAIGTDLNNKFVLVVNAENTLEYRPVTLGETINGLRIVTQGLAPEDVIVVNGLQRVRPAMQIKPNPVAMASDETLAALHAEQQTLDKASAALSSAASVTDNRG